MDISRKLKSRRKELKLTMLDVAKITGVSEATVSRWESGDIANMKRDKIVSLAKALQVSPSFIMDWPDDEPVISSPEIINIYNSLNAAGKAKADVYITDLSEQPKYRKETTLPNEGIYIPDNMEVAALGGIKNPQPPKDEFETT